MSGTATRMILVSCLGPSVEEMVPGELQEGFGYSPGKKKRLERYLAAARGEGELVTGYLAYMRGVLTPASRITPRAECMGTMDGSLCLYNSEADVFFVPGYAFEGGCIDLPQEIPLQDLPRRPTVHFVGGVDALCEEFTRFLSARVTWTNAKTDLGYALDALRSLPDARPTPLQPSSSA